MIQATTIRTIPRQLAERPLFFLLLGSVLALGLALGAAVAAVMVALAEAPPGVTASVDDGATDLPLTTTFRVQPEGWDARFEGAALYETLLDREGRRGAEREVPIEATVLREGWQPGQTELEIRPAGGTLRPDGLYRLVLRGSALVADLPWPRPASVEHEIRFSTPTSPRALALPQETRLKWQEPLRVRWSAPIDDFTFELTPPAPARSWVNAHDRRESFVLIEQPADGASYRIAVTAARGTNGMALQHPAEYTVATPIRPRLLNGDESRTVEIGATDPIRLRWNVPIERVSYEINPPLEHTWQVSRQDPTVAEVRLDRLAQGTTYELTVTDAVSREGAPLAESPTITLQTPPKLMVEDLDTGTESPRASVKTRPVVIFAEPIRDRRVAEAAITVEPSVRGRFEWLDDRRVRFIPNQPFPYDTEVTFRMRPGPDGPRSVAGGYFERSPVLSFTTELNKIIDVDVTRQVMTLIEDGRAVRTLPVATGVPGADTPIGEFTVQYKMPTARFRGTNVNGSRYDIPDVKWVIAFLGDYTIHGAYWRANFGAPGSNGCVSLTDDNAKAVYDWAPEGALVRIHY